MFKITAALLCLFPLIGGCAFEAKNPPSKLLLPKLPDCQVRSDPKAGFFVVGVGPWCRQIRIENGAIISRTVDLERGSVISESESEIELILNGERFPSKADPPKLEAAEIGPCSLTLILSERGRSRFKLTLSYAAFPHSRLISKDAEIENISDSPLALEGFTGEMGRVNGRLARSSGWGAEFELEGGSLIVFVDLPPRLRRIEVRGGAFKAGYVERIGKLRVRRWIGPGERLKLPTIWIAYGGSRSEAVESLKSIVRAEVEEVRLKLYRVVELTEWLEGAEIGSERPDRSKNLALLISLTPHARLIKEMGWNVVGPKGGAEPLPCLASDYSFCALLRLERVASELRPAVLILDGEIPLEGCAAGGHYHMGAGESISMSYEAAVRIAQRLREGNPGMVVALTDRLYGSDEPDLYLLSRGLSLAPLEDGGGEKTHRQ